MSKILPVSLLITDIWAAGSHCNSYLLLSLPAGVSESLITVTDNLTAVWDRLRVSPPYGGEEQKLPQELLTAGSAFLTLISHYRVLCLLMESAAPRHREWGNITLVSVTYFRQRLTYNGRAYDSSQGTGAFHKKGEGILLRDKWSNSLRLTLSLWKLAVTFPDTTP